MFEYFEFDEITCQTGMKRRVLISKSSIRIVTEVGPGECMIGEVRVKQSYDDVKRRMREDPRRFIHDCEIDFRLRVLKSIGIMSLIKTTGNERSVELIRRLMDAADETEAWAIVTEYPIDN